MATPNPANLAYAIGLPPADAIRYFESLGHKIAWDWREAAAAVKDRAFAAAGVMRRDVVQDLHAALLKSLKEGGTLPQFIDNITPTLQRKGWYGRGLIVDKPTGEITGKRLNARRLETIFQTNMQSAFMAGRYAQFMDNREARPNWEYVAVMDSRTRPAHRALHGRIFRWDDPAWGAFWPPNGYKCRCRVRARSDDDLRESGLKVSSSEGHTYQVERSVGGDKTMMVTAYKAPGMQHAFAPDAGFSHNPARDWYRPFTPAPLDAAPAAGLALRSAAPPLPRPTPVDPARVLPDGLQPQDYVSRFLAEFGAATGRPTVFRDVTQAPLVISDELFRTTRGEWKVLKDERHRYVLLLADTIREPDEVWAYWEPMRNTPGSSRLVRRYIRAFELPDRELFGYGVFEQSDEGWRGVTAFVPRAGRTDEARRRAINEQRAGHLIYSKGKTEGGGGD